MKFQGIQPFVRFVRYLKMEESSPFSSCVPVDARIFYVVSGAGRIRVRNETLSLRKGNLLYMNAGVEYHLLSGSVSYLAVNFDFTRRNAHLETPIPPVFGAEEASAAVLERIRFEDNPRFNDYCFFKECPDCFERLLRLEKEFMGKLPYYRNETSCLLASVLIRLARINEQRERKDGRFDLEKVASYIQKHYREPMDNRTLARLFHYHPNYLSSEFKRWMGIPIHQYLLETRILKASSLIEAGYRHTEEVAALCGFSDVKYFARYFKKVLGISPAKFASSVKK